MDMDATIKGYPVNKETIQSMSEGILAVKVDDNISFEIKSIGEIREGDEYTGFRVAMTANYEKMAVPLKLDITTGDKITPREIEYEYKLMLEDRSIRVLAYNLPTILAEKLETVITRGDQNTRPRDYYDIFILTKLQSGNVDLATLKDALRATTEKRGSVEVIKNYREIMQVVRTSPVMKR
jgi:predicted nucleotidyltransferase component of viral defense system